MSTISSRKVLEMIDKKQNFVYSIRENNDMLHTVYFGMKAAPLTLAHEKIIQYLVEEFLKYDNVELVLGVADSEFKDKFDLLNMVEVFVNKKYPGKKIDVVNQNGWQGLRAWLKEQNFNNKDTLVCIGEDEWKHLEKNDGVWIDALDFSSEYMFHMVKDRNDGISASKIREIFFRDPDVDYYYVKDLISKTIYDYIKKNELF